jgi:quercetin dioxygenase-like cupin family protein
MIKLTIAAHTALPWHTHPFPNAGYVLSGELTLQDRESGKSETFHAGQALAESVDDVHRGVSGDTATVLLLTYSVTPGTPTSIPNDVAMTALSVGLFMLTDGPNRRPGSTPRRNSA